jgi:hypothetical protein
MKNLRLAQIFLQLACSLARRLHRGTRVMQVLLPLSASQSASQTVVACLQKRFRTISLVGLRKTCLAIEALAPRVSAVLKNLASPGSNRSFV